MAQHHKPASLASTGKRKRVLVITYYWPPSAGSGVQRWLKTVKYLRSYGWEPVIYTVSNSQFELRDEALLHELPEGLEIIKQPIWEPFEWYNKFVGQGKKASQNVNPLYAAKDGQDWKSRLAVWVRSNVFVPDTRMFFIEPSVQFLTSYLKANPVDAMVSTGPPHSMHAIGLGVKQATGIPWLADFRDPWTQIGFYRELQLSPWARQRHEHLETATMAQADAVVAVSHAMAADMDTIIDVGTRVVHNGYDEADFEFKDSVQLAKDFTISYVGMLGKPRNHPVFWQALKHLVTTDEAFAAALRLEFHGKADPVVLQSAADYGLEQWLHLLPYRPHHEIIEVQRQSQVLLLMIDNVNNSKGILTGKIFEYLALQRPILCIGPKDGDAETVLNDTGAGLFSDYDDLEGLIHNLKSLFAACKAGNNYVQSSGYQQYSRRALAGKFAAILDEISATGKSTNSSH